MSDALQEFTQQTKECNWKRIYRLIKPQNWMSIKLNTEKVHNKKISKIQKCIFICEILMGHNTHHVS